MYEIFNFDSVKSLSDREMKALIPIFRNNLTVFELELSDRDGKTDYFSEPQPEKPKKYKAQKPEKIAKSKTGKGKKKKDSFSLESIE